LSDRFVTLSSVRSRPAVTKFARPPLPATLVRRPDLVGRVDAALQLPCTLIASSADAGKTVLLSSWVDGRTTRCSCRPCWPNDPTFTRVLHSRAGIWYEKSGHFVAAVEQFERARDLDRALASCTNTWHTTGSALNRTEPL
jgi:ATP/maltotriose-dependent transcriptional regulator MalT